MKMYMLELGKVSETTFGAAGIFTEGQFETLKPHKTVVTF